MQLTYKLNGRGVCFMHAVQLAMAGENITSEVFDDRDCGQSGAWWLYGCVECEKEEDKNPG